MPEHKSLRVEVKDADQGLVEAVFSRFDVLDSDGDVTRPGAFTDGAPVRISAYGHASWGGALPVGKGVIRVREDVAVLEGGFFLDTALGRDHFEVIKQMAELQEWSYGYDVKHCSFGEFEEHEDVRFLEELEVFEVSPVLVGAGVDTVTLAVKDRGLSFTQEAEAARAAVDGLTDRSRALAALRAKDGRVLSAANRDRLLQVAAGLRKGLTALDELAAAATGPDTDEQGKGLDPEGLRAYLQTVRARHILPSRR
jgi:HK97 family phage prohead protease